MTDTGRASARVSASGIRSTAPTWSPPASTADTRRETVAAYAATSSTCIVGSLPESAPGFDVPRIAKSRTASSIGIGMRSPAWNCNALMSSSRLITGISTWRTTTRGLAMPTRTGTFFKPTSARRRATASVTAASSATSPSRIASRGNAT